MRKPDYRPHYVYELRRVSEGDGPFRYIGVRTAKSGDPLTDSYMGSSRRVDQAVADGHIFEKTILEAFTERSAANARERELQLRYKASQSPDFYNLTTAARLANAYAEPERRRYRSPDGQHLWLPAGSQLEGWIEDMPYLYLWHDGTGERLISAYEGFQPPGWMLDEAGAGKRCYFHIGTGRSAWFPIGQQPAEWGTLAGYRGSSYQDFHDYTDNHDDQVDAFCDRIYAFVLQKAFAMFVRGDVCDEEDFVDSFYNPASGPVRNDAYEEAACDAYTEAEELIEESSCVTKTPLGAGTSLREAREKQIVISALFDASAPNTNKIGQLLNEFDEVISKVEIEGDGNPNYDVPIWEFRGLQQISVDHLAILEGAKVAPQKRDIDAQQAPDDPDPPLVAQPAVSGLGGLGWIIAVVIVVIAVTILF